MLSSLCFTKFRFNTRVSLITRELVEIRRLGKNLGVKMPIYHEICRILNENKSPKEAMQRLVKRDLKDELNEDYQLIHRREK